MYVSYNANPEGNKVGDCTVRAISMALNQPWEATYAGVAVEGMRMLDMPSANAVWGSYLSKTGLVREIIPNTCPDCYTVEDFCRDNPNGTYILALSGHVVAVIDGKYYDTWDSGGEIQIYYWYRKDDVNVQ